MDFGWNPWFLLFWPLAPLAALATSSLRKIALHALVTVIVGATGWWMLLSGWGWNDAQWLAYAAAHAITPEAMAQYNEDAWAKGIVFFLGLPFSLAYAVGWVGIVQWWRHRRGKLRPAIG